MLREIVDIPIYRCSLECHKADMESRKERFASSFRGNDEVARRKRKELREYFDKAMWYPWRYNEVIGYIRVSTRRSEIVGELFLRDAKRIGRRPTARFCYRGEPIFFHIGQEWSGEQIAERLRSSITAFQGRDKRLRKRFIDTGILSDISPYLDWRGLVDETETVPNQAVQRGAGPADAPDA